MFSGLGGSREPCTIQRTAQHNTEMKKMTKNQKKIAEILDAPPREAQMLIEGADGENWSVDESFDAISELDDCTSYQFDLVAALRRALDDDLDAILDALGDLDDVEKDVIVVSQQTRCPNCHEDLLAEPRHLTHEPDEGCAKAAEETIGFHVAWEGVTGVGCRKEFETLEEAEEFLDETLEMTDAALLCQPGNLRPFYDDRQIYND